MTQRTLMILVAVALVLGGLAVAEASRVRYPGNDVGYEPEQPIAYSHKLHAGDLGIQCLYCHHGAERSKNAGIPSASVCMNCHKAITARWDTVRPEVEAAKKEGREPRRIVAPELQKLYDAFDARRPIEWVQVHKMPDFVTFEHRAHVNAGVACEACHGPIKTMERVRQVSSLSMGWCIDCHRGGSVAKANGVTTQASIDCGTCHR